MTTTKAKADYARAEKKRKGPKSMTMYAVAIFFDGRFNRMVDRVFTVDVARSFVRDYNGGCAMTPWTAKARKVKIKWPERKAVTK